MRGGALGHISVIHSLNASSTGALSASRKDCRSADERSFARRSMSKSVRKYPIATDARRSLAWNAFSK